MSKIYKKTKDKRTLSYERKKSLYGYGFIFPWIIGFILFFLRPLISIVSFSVSKINYLDIGYDLEYIGIAQYLRAFLEDPDTLRMMTQSFSDMIIDTPVIIIVSLCVAVILNKKFIGRTVARTIFFVPVIVASGIVISILKGDIMSSTMLAGQKSSVLLQVSGLRGIMMEMGLPDQVIKIITDTSNGIFDLLWKSGIQILLFLAALQTISPSLYEASAIEGATEWDNFWKIMIPMVSPMILIALVYSIVDSFTDYNNLFMRKITGLTTNLSIEYSSALSLIYFVFVMIFVIVVYKIVSRFVFYSVD
ncbi:MAG: sugar ABC transporter permease [Eubacteriales bacterium]|jgi:ABC-type sugar transport system permease subunit|nr:sugar ABC transporter permease [Eubacteriales bacterium]MDD4327233.1 sugar ABC transporter permease [Eubacteriales bacterium]MDD4717596.1 sugar ABC transporter permease [Eubacteriales bacterium]